MRRLLALALALVAAATFGLAATANARAANPGYTYNSDLRWWVHQTLEVASWSDTDDQTKTIPKPVEVRCYSNGRTFDAGYKWRSGGNSTVSGAYRVEAYYEGTGNTIHMRTLTCSQAIRFTQGIITPTTSAAFETLLHEALHRHGFEGEWKTEQFAIAAMFTAGRLVRWSKAVNNGADRDLYWDGAAKEPGYNAVAYALIANEERPAEYRVTTQDVVRAIGLGWANSAY